MGTDSEAASTTREGRDQQVNFERASQVLAEQPLSGLLGARLLAIEPGRAELAVPLGENARQHPGIAHGGLIAFLAGAALTVPPEASAAKPCAPPTWGSTFSAPRAARTGRPGRGHSPRGAIDRLSMRVYELREDGEIRCAAPQGTISSVNRSAESGDHRGSPPATRRGPETDRVAEAVLYDAIGTGYANRRQADPRISAAVRAALGDARRIVNVGAGAGSYEPPDITAAAVEPSSVMAAQRPDHLVPATLATSENLPFIDGVFDGALAVLTLHHWDDVGRGLEELRRVVDGPIVIVTADPAISTAWWLAVDYPELKPSIAEPLPSLASLGKQLGEIEVRVLPVPSRCVDGFLMACWDRPEMLLDPEARAATSCFAKLDAETERSFAERLEADLRSGRWDARNGALRMLPEFDTGLRLVIARG